MTVRQYLIGLAAGVLLVSSMAAGYAAHTDRTWLLVADSAFAVSVGGQSFFRVNVDGRVGIGTSDPDSTVRLHVVGNIKADSVKVNAVRFSDGTVQTTANAPII